MSFRADASLVLSLLGAALTVTCGPHREEPASSLVPSALRRTLRDFGVPAERPLRVVPTPIAPTGDGTGRYVIRRRDLSVFFSPRGFALSLAGRHGLHANFLGASPVAPLAERPLPGTVLRYGGDAARFPRATPTYERLAWEELYEGVDLLVDATPGRAFSYRFVLSPGADPKRIAMEWAGARSVRASDDGRDLEVATDVGVLTVRGLRAFAIEDRGRRELSVRHVVRGTTVFLDVDGWSGRVPLVVDPSVGWSSFLGGSGGENANAVALDGSGNVLVAGLTESTNFPATGGFDATLGDSTGDGFVAKLAPSGALLWSTYLGGVSEDVATAVSTNAAGEVVVTGYTQSSNFPLLGGLDTTLGVLDAFVTKLSPSGALVWSRFLGGAGGDLGYGVALDPSGNALVAGYTRSSDFPTTGGFDTTLGSADGDAFLTKVSGAGAIVWSSYLGGSYTDSGYGVATDASGNAFVTGYTESANFPTTGGFDTIIGGGVNVPDAFVAKVSSAGALLWSSFLGGASSDRGRAIAVSPSGDAFVTGETTSSDFPASGGFDATFGGGTNADAFLTRVSSSGALIWSSYLGGAFASDRGYGVAVDGSGSVVVVGSTSSNDFPISGGFDITRAGQDAFVFHKALGASGAACTVVSDCSTAYCVDGVCCDRSCGAPCEACTAAKRGSGVDGTCGPIAADTDPKNACAPTGGVCGGDGFCDGVGSCRSFARAGTPCGATACTAGAVTGRVCKGDSATCTDATTPCAPYACAAAACKTSCASDADCDASAFCASNVCVPKSSNGKSCGTARECTSNLCVDGVCCNAACTGQCEVCNEPGSVGTCTPIAGAPRGGRAACKGAPCDGTCGGSNGASCSYEAGRLCAASCSGAHEIVSRCDASGACVAAAPRACIAYACESSTGCKSSCVSEGDCASKYRCLEGKCEPVTARCSDDGTNTTNEATGIVTQCAKYRCDPASGACRGSCTSESDCAAWHLCSSGGQCVAPPDTADDGGCALGGSRANAGAALLVALLVLVERRRQMLSK